MQFARPIPFAEAVQKLGQRTVVASKLDSHDWAFRVPLALRERAFFSSQVESAQFLQRSKDLLGDWMQSNREAVTLPDGSSGNALKVGSRDDFVRQTRTFALEEGMGPLDPKDAGTIKDITSRKRLQMIFDVQTQQAHDYGYWKQGQDPVLLDEFPAQRFIREAAVKQPRQIHQQNEGVVRLKSDIDFWMQMNSPTIGGFGVPWGPWGFGSGMGVEDVDRDEAEELGLIAPGDQVLPAEQQFNDKLKASTENLDEDVVSFLKDTFGDQVKLESGSVMWSGKTTVRTLSPSPAIDPTPVPPSAPGPVSVPSPTSLPAPEPARPVPPAATPTTPRAVGEGFVLPKSGKLRPKAAAALKSIDEVHSDGKLDGIPVTAMSSKSDSYGVAVRNRAGKVVKIGVQSGGPWPELTTDHEIGHVLDWAVMGGGSAFASQSATGPLAAVMRAIQQTDAVKRLQSMLADTTSRAIARHLVYATTGRELWARAYAQYIATRSKSTVLKDQLATRIKVTGPEQWSAEDFAPVAAAIDAAFKDLNWL